jgi:HPt (histidine-containing phosphotransfer) domain-containing protein
MDRLMGDESLAQTVIEVFLDDMPRQIEALKEQVDAADPAGVQSQAHKIKGAAANVSGEALCALAFALERASQAGDLAAVAARMPELEDRFNRLRAAMGGIGDREIAGI